MKSRILAGLLFALLLTAASPSEVDTMSFSLIIPEATTNLITNPSVEDGTTGYSAAAGGSLARVASSGDQRRGIYGLEYTPSAVVDDGVYYELSLGSGVDYTFSVDFKGAAGISYRIYAYDVTAVATLTAITDFEGDDQWHRYDVTFHTSGNSLYRVYVLKNGETSVAPFYTDGWQVEQKSYQTTYCDGDQDGCEWSAGDHASASTRKVTTRAGGQVIDLSDYNIQIGEIQGLGMPPIRHNVQNISGRAGAVLQSLKTEPRVIQLSAVTETETESEMYSTLSQLEAALKENAVPTLQPVRIRYTRVDRELEIQCYYDSGLEGNWVEHTYTRFILRLICYDPYWYEVGNVAQSLSYKTDLTVNLIARRVDGAWDDMPQTAGGTLYYMNAVVESLDGLTAYLGGTYLNWDNDSATDRIVAFNTVTGAYTNIGTVNGGTITRLVLSPDGSTLYAMGAFTDVNSISNTADIARYDVATDTWSAMGSGAFNSSVEDIEFGDDGLLYAVGYFTTAGGVAANRIAVWNGTTWAALSTGLDGAGLGLTKGHDGKLYIVGLFITAGGVSTQFMATYDPATATWGAIGTGATTDGFLYDIDIAPSGLIYLAGYFDLIDGITAHNVALWNGNTFQALGEGVNERAFYVYVADNGFVYVSGRFTTAGGVALPDRTAVWNGSSWGFVDIDTTITQGVIVPIGDTLYYLGQSPDGGTTPGTGTGQGGAITTVTNEGSADAYPKFIFSRSGGTSAIVYSIINHTTGQQILLNMPLLDGETVTFDLTEQAKTLTSNFRSSQSLLRYLVPGFDVSTMRLMPGDNDISLLISVAGSPTITAFVEWQNQFLSAPSADR